MIFKQTFSVIPYSATHVEVISFDNLDVLHVLFIFRTVICDVVLSLSLSFLVGKFRLQELHGTMALFSSKLWCLEVELIITMAL